MRERKIELLINTQKSNNMINRSIGTFWNVILAAVMACLSYRKTVVFGLFVLGMFLTPASTHAQVTLSGTVYSDVGVTAQAVAKTIRVAVGTSTVGVYSTTSTVTTGAWTVTIPSGHSISTSTPILVWIDNDATTRGQVLTKSNSSQSAFSITGLDIYQDRVIARHEATSGTSTTLADFSFYTAANDSDVQHSTSTGQLTIASGNELYVWSGKTFAPGSAVTILANATASTTDGSMFLASTSVYVAGGTLTLGGSLMAISTATFTGGFFTTIFNATTTGKVINAPIASIGNVTLSGLGGDWTFMNAATTSALSILQGTVVAPTTTLAVTGTFQNDATFTQSGGIINIVGASTVALGDIALLVNGLDVSGSAAGTLSQNITSFAVSGNTLYVGQIGSATGCSQAAGSAQGCELLVFNVASTSNPVFVAGRDSSGSAAGTSTMSVASLLVRGTTLYVAKTASGSGCSQTVGLAAGCELIVFSIASTTNPIFAGGRDADGTLGGTTNLAATSLAVSGNALYMSKTLSGTTNCSTTASNCELLVFNIASTTNPLYVYGLDASGSNTGTLSVAINAVSVVGNALYVVKAGQNTACSQTAGSAQGCELMVFSIASTTLPVYSRGVDVNGSQTGTGNLAITSLLASGTALYLGTAASSNVCTQTTGSLEGCELQMYSIASTTNPVFGRGVDAAGSYTGRQSLGVTNFALAKNYLYVTKAGNATVCAPRVGFALGCELMIFDVASTSAMRLIAGRDADGTSAGVTATAGNAVVAIGESVILGKAAAGTTACSTTRANCELIIFSASTTPRGLLFGSMNSTSSLGNVALSGSVQFKDTASVTNLTIASGTTTAPSLLTIAGNYTNNGIFDANEGTMLFASNAAQTLSGTLAGSSSLYRAIFSGSGTKTFSTSALSSFVEIQSGATVVAPTQLTVADTFTNNGTYTAGSNTLATNGFLNSFLSGVSAGGSATDTIGLALNAFAQKNNTVYVAKVGNGTGCSQTAGLAAGCELMTFDVSSTTNPIYRAGRDVDGSTTGTGNITIQALAVSGNSLYVAKAAAGTTACSNTAGAAAAACELMVFDISSTTNPIYTAGRDATGSNAGTSTLAINQLFVSGNALYVAKAGSTTACSQTAGLAGGCELMVFDISSTSNPVFAAGRDADGTNAGVTVTSATSLGVSSSTLYMSKVAAGAACTTAAFCELMIFNVASTTNPIYVTGIDASGNNTGAQSVNINSIAVSGSKLYAAKAGGATTCSATAGSTGAASCELMVFDIASTTNPIYRAGVDAGGATNGGTQNLALNSLTASGTVVYAAKAGNATVCSQVAGSAVGCELMVFDTSSTTNPLYVAGQDSSGLAAGQSALNIQSVFTAGNTVYVGKALDTTVCELEIGLRTGCELLLFKAPTTVGGTLTGSSALGTVVANGLTQFVSTASTSALTIASSSVFTAPTTSLSVAGNLTINGSFAHNNGQVILSGTNQFITAAATTTLYDFIQIATTSATTTFSIAAPFIVLTNLVLEGAGTTTPLRLQSASTTAQWRIDPQSSTTITLSFLNVQNSNNISATTTVLVCSAGCIDGGNNTNWELGVQLQIAGVLYQADGVTPVATSTALKLIVGGEILSIKQTSSASTTGIYSFPISQSLLTAGTKYVVFADNNSTVKGSAFTIANNSGLEISDVSIYSNHAIIRNETPASATTNTDLSFYTSTSDSDVLYSMSAGTLTVATNTALLIWDSSQFAPGGAVTVPSAGINNAFDGTLTLQSGATYTAGGNTAIAGSLNIASTGSYIPGDYVTTFTATSSGKVINVPNTTIGNVTFLGSGAWSFTQADVTVKDFKIDAGTVTAPSGTLTSNGVFQNYATFDSNSGTLAMSGSSEEFQSEILTFVSGRDTAGAITGTSSVSGLSSVVVGNYLYLSKFFSASPCSQTIGLAEGCELMVFDISSSTNPVYVVGRDASGDSSGTGSSAIFGMSVLGSSLYVTKSANATACSQVAGSAIGCELMVFDISSSTNPVYVAGRDASGDSTGIGSINMATVLVSGTQLFAGKAGNTTACSQTAGSAIGCELMVFDISSSTNPVYVAGRDASGDSTGIQSLAINVVRRADNGTLLVGKDASATACSQTIGSAIGCELMVFDISSSTNPVYVAGRDADGSAAGTSALSVYALTPIGSSVGVGKQGNATACSQTAGTASGCELMIFSTASSTNPLYTLGRDASGDSSGVGNATIQSVSYSGSNLYVGKGGVATACSQTISSATGCELMVFDISSSTNPIYVAGRDADGSVAGTSTVGVSAMNLIGTKLYTIKSGDATACSQVAGSATGCELMVFATAPLTGVAQGKLTGATSLSNITTTGYSSIRDTASTSDITISSGSTLTLPNQLTVAGNLTNSGTLLAPAQSTLFASSSLDQVFSGILTGTSSLQNVVFSGAQEKSFSDNASTSDFTILNGATVSAPSALTISGDYINNSSFISNEGQVTFDATVQEYVSGRDVSGDSSGTSVVSIRTMVSVGNYLFTGRGANATACSQTAGSAIGCELMVFDISSSTNPIYVAGRDASGSAAGTGSLTIRSLAVSGTSLVVTKEADATACSQTAGSAIGCELMVFDISSSTNPIYVAGRDASGSAAGTTAITMRTIVVDNNNAYIGKDGSATACSQVAGSAIGCELMVFDISISSNPLYSGGNDVSGSISGTGSSSVTSLVSTEGALFVGKAASTNACSQTAGSAIGCELMVFDLSGNPTYLAGQDSSGSVVGTDGIDVTAVAVIGNKMFVGKVGNATACSQVAGSAIGCEIMAFNISSTSNPLYLSGRDVSGDRSGVGNSDVTSLTDGIGNVYVGKGGNSTACSQTAGSAIGCELVTFDNESTLQGAFTGSNTFTTVTIQNKTRLLNSASTTNIVIATTGLFTAPTTTLSLLGNFDNQGSFAANGGTVTLLGTNQILTSLSTTTFNNLTQVTAPDAEAQTTFSNTGAFVTTGALTLRGTSTAPLLLRSTTPGVQWTILPFGTTSASWLDVKDSRNASSTSIDCTNFCLNKGNNLGWVFSSSTPGTGSSTLLQHSAGQVSNVFAPQSVVDGSLLGFRLQPNSGNTTVGTVTVDLVGLRSITSSDFTNIRLVIDYNGNKILDGGDEIVSSSGAILVSGESGTITFAEGFLATTSLDYLVVADIAAQPNGSFMGVTLIASGVRASDSTGAQTIFMSTDIRVQHNRSNKGSGGSSSGVGDVAPVGDGDMGGGDTAGGELIGDDPDFFWPTNDSGSWGGGANAYDRNDSTYATASSAINHSYSSHGFAIPTNNTVGGIEVKLELSGTTAAGSVDVQLSWDGGVSWTSSKTTPTLTTADGVRVLGSGSDLWGRSWTADEFSNANFAVRVAGSPSSNTIRLDAIQVRVYHVSSGGGAGGGGGEGGGGI